MLHRNVCEKVDTCVVRHAGVDGKCGLSHNCRGRVGEKNSHRGAQTHSAHPDVMCEAKIRVASLFIAVLSVDTDEYTMFGFRYTFAGEVIINAFVIVIYKHADTVL